MLPKILAVPFPFLSLVAAPLLALYWSTPWMVTREVEVREVALVDPAAGPAGEAAELVPRAEGTHPHEGLRLPRGWRLEAAVPALVLTGASVQADAASSYQLLGSADGSEWTALWNVPALPHRRGLVTRISPPFEPTAPLAAVALTSQVTDGLRAVGRLSLEVRDSSYPPFATLVLLLWPAWCLLALAAPRPPGDGTALCLLALWKGADAWLFALLFLLLAFRPDSPLFLGGATALVLTLAGRALSRLRPAPLAALAGGIGLALAAAMLLQQLAEDIVLRRLEKVHDLTVDHRPRPGGEINDDHVRFRGTADDLDDDDFNLVFLGDSFTFGIDTPYEQAYPYVFERLAAELDCRQRVRVVNMGWVSASPLLALRLLRDVGAAYRPDLVLYNLDMSDFHDDLRYEKALRDNDQLVHLDPDRLWSTALRQALLGDALKRVADAVAASTRSRTPAELLTRDVTAFPHDRFFITNQPLELSRPFIEAGVMRNLAALEDYARDALGADFAVVLLPRAFQYSRTESLESWERDDYEILGEHSQEPFRYFAEVEDELPYPVTSLLPAFRASRRFPLYRHDDPHWTAAGNEVAAEGLLAALRQAGLLPCS